MKYLKNIVAILVLVGIFNLSYWAELGVDNIEVIDANTISVTLSENPNLEIGELEWEIRVLNDVKLRWALTSESNMRQAELILEDPITTDTTYSLLTVLGEDGSISFTTPSILEWFTFSNTLNTESQDIDSIEIVDDRSIIVTYRNEISSSSLEYKLLAESVVTKIEKPDFYLPEILLSVEPPLVSEKNYILMFIEMQDAGGEYLEFDTWIYDFETPIMDEQSWATIENEIVTEESLEVIFPEWINQVDIPELTDNWDVENNQEDIVIVEFEEEDTKIIDVEKYLNAAGEEVEIASDTELLDTEFVAANVVETPDTGAQTWVLILATLVINSFYYLSRRKKPNTTYYLS